MSGIATVQKSEWQFILFTMAISYLGKLSGDIGQDERQVYNKQFKQAPWAPPAWLFAPAWTTINFFLLKSVKRILKQDLPDKKKLLLLQAAIWSVFFSFNYVYFKKRSPVLATIWTMADNVFAIASFVLALKNDKRTALNYLPLLMWTAYASTLSGYQALYNKDPYLHTKPLAKMV